MHDEHQIPIWFFIGGLLLIYGVLITGAGLVRPGGTAPGGIEGRPLLPAFGHLVGRVHGDSWACSTAPVTTRSAEAGKP